MWSRWPRRRLPASAMRRGPRRALPSARSSRAAVRRVSRPPSPRSAACSLPGFPARRSARWCHPRRHRRPGRTALFRSDPPRRRRPCLTPMRQLAPESPAWSPTPAILFPGGSRAAVPSYVGPGPTGGPAQSGAVPVRCPHSIPAPRRPRWPYGLPADPGPESSLSPARGSCRLPTRLRRGCRLPSPRRQPGTLPIPRPTHLRGATARVTNNFFPTFFKIFFSPAAPGVSAGKSG